MRRQFIVVALALLLAGGFALSADEAVLMDFSLLKADILPDQNNQGKMTENKGTMMDFSSIAGTGFSDKEKAQMRISLAIKNWDVRLASSSRSINNQDLSYCTETAVSANAPQYAGKAVMGVRIHFPSDPFNSWARISPPFSIPAFEPKATIGDDGKITPAAAASGSDAVNARLTRFEGSYDATSKVTTALGIVKNVGTLKSISVTVYGLQFPHGLSAVIADERGNEHAMFMGYLNFAGWKTLTWDNPQYVSQVRNRELRVDPLYPLNSPMVRFAGFVVTRDGSAPGGDFVAYFKDVKMLYDRAVLDPVRDIDDEATWGIITKQETDRKNSEAMNFGAMAVQRYIEAQKQETRGSDILVAPTATK